MTRENGLICSIWTNDVATAHRTASAVEAGYVWVNVVGRHFPGTPFGGYKQSRIGREECLEELISYTQEKSIHIRLLQPKNAFAFSTMPADLESSMQERNTPYETDVDPCKLERKKQ